MAAKRASQKAQSANVFGQARSRAKMLRVGLYARVSTTRQAENDLSIPDQLRQLKEYATAHNGVYGVCSLARMAGRSSNQVGRLPQQADCAH